ncbi:MAG TPA: hypothetical protein PLE30_04260 [Candidatus Kapabacteria bacterium]|nr:hypothetical protein [Candidatus Kapabacteria bacterium]
MQKTLFDFLLNFKIVFLQKFGSEVEKLAINVADEYYLLLKSNILHDDIIHRIIKTKKSNTSSIESYNKFIYSSKLDSDSLYDRKYGSRAKFIINLYKLILSIHLDKEMYRDVKAYEIELNLSILKLNKGFNKIILYMFKKYFNE